jgi:hypothetical protein
MLGALYLIGAPVAATLGLTYSAILCFEKDTAISTQISCKDRACEHGLLKEYHKLTSEYKPEKLGKFNPRAWARYTKKLEEFKDHCH